jgi:hypothetical protein
MNIAPHDDREHAWLDDLLTADAAGCTVDDDGFSARVMQRLDAFAPAAARAASAPCIAPASALDRLGVITRQERQRDRWQVVAATAAAAIGLVTWWAQPVLETLIALVIVATAWPWLLMRDPRF